MVTHLDSIVLERQLLLPLNEIVEGISDTSQVISLALLVNCTALLDQGHFLIDDSLNLLFHAVIQRINLHIVVLELLIQFILCANDQIIQIVLLNPLFQHVVLVFHERLNFLIAVVCTLHTDSRLHASVIVCIK